MPYIKIKNKKNTTGKKPPPGYLCWLDFWQAQKGGAVSFGCLILNCRGIAEVGGHVIKYRDTSKEYILPICKSCNNKHDDVFETLEEFLVAVAD